MHNNKDQWKQSVNSSRFWILGAGQFGKIAVSRILRRYPKATVTVVDKAPIAIASDALTVVHADAIAWLKRVLAKDSPVDMVVPAIPENVVAGWLTLNLTKQYTVNMLPIPDAWLAKMPNAIRGKRGQAFVSHADFICPDNCPEPERLCTFTGKPRPVDLFRLLESIDLEGILPIVLRSHQLLPGVGVLYPADLWQALYTASRNSHRPLMIATACRCHGVVDFFRLERRSLQES